MRIGKAISRPKDIGTGVPQGGILSPIIFTIFGADLEEWTKNSTIFSYADDTSSSSSGKSEEEVKEKLEQDVEEILKFMASLPDHALLYCVVTYDVISPKFLDAPFRLLLVAASLG